MASKKVSDVLQVSCNGMTTQEAIASIKRRLETVEKSVFNIAVLGWYSLGNVVPACNDKPEAVNDNPISPKSFYTQVGRSHSTLSRWIGALKLVIEAGDWIEFATGLYPFSYDKIFLIYGEDTKAAFTGLEKADVLRYSVTTLKDMCGKNKPATKQEAASEEGTPAAAEATPEATEEAEAVMVQFEYNGITYEVAEAAMKAFIATCTVVAEEEAEA